MITRKDRNAIRAIAERAVAIYDRLDVKVTRTFVESELAIVHDEIVALHLQEMLDADDFNLMHDVMGIHRHLEIGEESRLTRGFCPRFADWGQP